MIKLLFLLVILLPATSLAAIHGENVNTCKPTQLSGKTHYVSTTGHDYKGKGTIDNPWKTIAFAVFKAQDNDTIIVAPGEYNGETRLKKSFNKTILVKAQYPYLSRITNAARALVIVKNAQNITIEGFEITHSEPNARPLVVHVDAYGGDGLNNITLKNNIIHDSYNNDLLKINFGAQNVNVHCNIFYNQGNSDEHIDINSAANVDVSDNIFFNDFPASGREITRKSSSYIVVKDSNDKDDRFTGATNINIHRNVFFNWQGSHGHGFILVGEDGKPYYEANNVNIYNNLFIGNSPISMRSPFSVKGARDIKFFNNTTVGDLPSNAYALRVRKENKNHAGDNISLYNNIWSDSTGTMGMGEYESSTDFSDTLYSHIDNFSLHNNLIYNGNEDLPSSLFDVVNPSDDKALKHFDPIYPRQDDVVTPVWNSKLSRFAGDYQTIRGIFLNLVERYGRPYSQNLDYSESTSNPTPKYDIKGNLRTPPYSLGALELSTKN